MTAFREDDHLPLSADGTPRMDALSPDPAGRREGVSRPLPDDAMIILAVRDMVLFPGIVAPIGIGRERSRAAVKEAVRLERPIGLLLQSAPDIEEPGPNDLHWVGTTATVVRHVTSAEGTQYAIARGDKRFRVLQFL
ncbi:MAG TPA: LON peptidase substrate-binding domain-containing protein, partial [Usitatibacter sp.]|nr:LON peptidase substrate-binding domain-containing protein [Usitatibacter sp.]